MCYKRKCSRPIWSPVPFQSIFIMLYVHTQTRRINMFKRRKRRKREKVSGDLSTEPNNIIFGFWFRLVWKVRVNLILCEINKRKYVEFLHCASMDVFVYCDNISRNSFKIPQLWRDDNKIAEFGCKISWSFELISVGWNFNTR